MHFVPGGMAALRKMVGKVLWRAPQSAGTARSRNLNIFANLRTMSVLCRFCCKSRLARMVPVNGSTEDARLDLPASKLSTRLLRYAMH